MPTKALVLYVHEWEISYCREANISHRKPKQKVFLHKYPASGGNAVFRQQKNRRPALWLLLFYFTNHIALSGIFEACVIESSLVQSQHFSAASSGRRALLLNVHCGFNLPNGYRNNLVWTGQNWSWWKLPEWRSIKHLTCNSWKTYIHKWKTSQWLRCQLQLPTLSPIFFHAFF